MKIKMSCKLNVSMLRAAPRLSICIRCSYISMFTKQQRWPHKTCYRKNQKLRRSDVKYSRYVRVVWVWVGVGVGHYCYITPYTTADGVCHEARVLHMCIGFNLLSPENTSPQIVFLIAICMHTFVEPLLSVCELFLQRACNQHET